MYTNKNHCYLAVSNHGNHEGHNRIWNLTLLPNDLAARKMEKELKEKYQDDRTVDIMTSDDVRHYQDKGNRLTGDIQLFAKCYGVRDKEAGNIIEDGLSYYEALDDIQYYEALDIKEGNFTPDFYEIFNEND